MTTRELTREIERLNTIKEMISKMKKEADEIESNIKDLMNEEEVSEIVLDDYIVRYQDIESNRLDTAKFKREMNNVYISYLRTVSSKKFTITVC